MVSLTASQVGVGVARKGKDKVGELYREKLLSDQLQKSQTSRN